MDGRRWDASRSSRQCRGRLRTCPVELIGASSGVLFLTAILPFFPFSSSIVGAQGVIDGVYGEKISISIVEYPCRELWIRYQITTLLFLHFERFIITEDLILLNQHVCQDLILCNVSVTYIQFLHKFCRYSHCEVSEDVSEAIASRAPQNQHERLDHRERPNDAVLQDHTPQ